MGCISREVPGAASRGFPGPKVGAHWSEAEAEAGHFLPVLRDIIGILDQEYVVMFVCRCKE